MLVNESNYLSVCACSKFPQLHYQVLPHESLEETILGDASPANIDCQGANPPTFSPLRPGRRNLLARALIKATPTPTSPTFSLIVPKPFLSQFGNSTVNFFAGLGNGAQRGPGTILLTLVAGRLVPVSLFVGPGPGPPPPPFPGPLPTASATSFHSSHCLASDVLS